MASVMAGQLEVAGRGRPLKDKRAVQPGEACDNAVPGKRSKQFARLRCIYCSGAMQNRTTGTGPAIEAARLFVGWSSGEKLSRDAVDLALFPVLTTRLVAVHRSESDGSGRDGRLALFC
jgi:hypothetical protein